MPVNWPARACTISMQGWGGEAWSVSGRVSIPMSQIGPSLWLACIVGTLLAKPPAREALSKNALMTALSSLTRRNASGATPVCGSARSGCPVLEATGKCKSAIRALSLSVKEKNRLVWPPARQRLSISGPWKKWLSWLEKKQPEDTLARCLPRPKREPSPFHVNGVSPSR